MARALIFGCSHLTLTPQEESLFRDSNPWGFILFARNIESPTQVQELTSALRETVKRSDAPIFIDQEGGRVQRLAPPHWLSYPPANTYLKDHTPQDLCQAEHHVRQASRLLAYDLRQLGITGDCMPVLDLAIPGAHSVIGNRAYSHDPQEVAILGRAAAQGLLAGNVLPVIKHIPGHGRALVDSHEHLPEVHTPLNVLEAEDFLPFRALADMPLAMTAHILYTALDPLEPATTSPYILQTVIRKSLGYKGFIMSDDIAMKALSGSLSERAERALQAGCDCILHCNGILNEMEELTKSVCEFSELAKIRAEKALSFISNTSEPFHREEAQTSLAEKFFPFFTTTTV
jgi:beta-N-acetylhexosaminidase